MQSVHGPQRTILVAISVLNTYVDDLVTRSFQGRSIRLGHMALVT